MSAANVVGFSLGGFHLSNEREPSAVAGAEPVFD